MDRAPRDIDTPGFRIGVSRTNGIIGRRVKVPVTGIGAGGLATRAAWGSWRTGSGRQLKDVAT